MAETQTNLFLNKMPKISVIIPFYQKEEGILRKAIVSALNQNIVCDIDILVIDDGSPVSAEVECGGFSDQKNATIKIIKQANKGPAAARNRGLDSVSADTVYVAFLDSDDEWTSDHLHNAIASLEAGNDFYFSDHYQLGQTVSAFNRAKRINVDEHPLLFSDNPVLYHYTGDMQEQIVTGNIIGTSTVVYRFAHNPSLRFREDLIRAGEDYLFWLAFTATSKNNIAFSSAAEAVYGKGVNIYSGTQFGGPEYLELVYYETKYKKTILREFRLSTRAQKGIKKSLEEYNLNFLRGILNSFRRGRWGDIFLLFRFLALSPGFLISSPINFIKIIKQKV